MLKQLHWVTGSLDVLLPSLVQDALMFTLDPVKVLIFQILEHRVLIFHNHEVLWLAWISLVGRCAGQQTILKLLVRIHIFCLLPTHFLDRIYNSNDKICKIILFWLLTICFSGLICRIILNLTLHTCCVLI